MLRMADAFLQPVALLCLRYLIWLTETESAVTAGHLTMFKLGSGKRPFQDGAMRIFDVPSTSSKGPAFSN